MKAQFGLTHSSVVSCFTGSGQIAFETSTGKKQGAKFWSARIEERLESAVWSDFLILAGRSDQLNFCPVFWTGTCDPPA